MKIEIFDPPMCCPTGVCGPAVDPTLVQFASDLDWLKSQGIEVQRYNLSQHPDAFAGNEVVRGALSELGNSCLPLTLIDGVIVASKKYPTRVELANFCGLELKSSLMTDAVRELIAIGAAIGSNCESCFKYHYNKARKLGVSNEDMLLAVQLAQTVKDSSARLILDLANRMLSDAPAPKFQVSCCGPKPGPSTEGKCC